MLSTLLIFSKESPAIADRYVGQPATTCTMRTIFAKLLGAGALHLRSWLLFGHQRHAWPFVCQANSAPAR